MEEEEVDYFNEGYEAWTDEKSKDECPYLENSEQWSEWIDGWECAEEESCDDDED